MRRAPRVLGILLLAAALISSVAFLVGLALAWYGGDPVGPTDSYISELSVGPSGSDSSFVVMIVGLAVFTGAFYVLAPGRLRSSLPGVESALRAGTAFGVAGSTALLAMTLFPLDPVRPIVWTSHIALATVAFFATSGATGAYSFVLRGQAGSLRWARMAARICSPATAAFGVLLVLAEVLHAIEPSPLLYLVEWFAFFAYAGWIVLTGVGLALLPAVDEASHGEKRRFQTV